MKKIIAIFIVVVACGALIWGIFTRINESRLSDDGDQDVVQKIPVHVMDVTEITLPHSVSYSGTLEPWQQVQIIGQNGLRIDALLVREGDYVKRGQLLARLDDTNLQQAQIELNLARADRDRLKRLVDIGAVARQQLEQAQARFDTVQRNVTLLRDNTNIRAPIDGVVTATYFVAGENFVPGMQSPALLTIQQLNPLKVVINVAESYFPDVKRGMNADVRVDAYGDRHFEGKVELVNPTISPDSRTFRVEITLSNDDELLAPGMSSNVSLYLGDITGRFLPGRAVLTRPGSAERYVYIVDGDKARRTYITVGERAEQYLRIVDGLSDDAQVITEGMGRLSDGAPIRIVDEGAL